MNTKNENTLLCPGCEQQAKTDYLGTRGVTKLMKCRNCGLVFADREFWQNPYETQDYYEDSKDGKYIVKYTETHMDRLRFIARWIDQGSILDFGGGKGETALAAHHLGFNATLIEDSCTATEMGSKYYPQITWIHSTEIPPEIPSASLDIVTGFHVLEHVPFPRELIRQSWRVLKPGGLLCIEVPNWGSLMRRIKGLKWIFVLNHHVNHFDKHTLRNTIEPIGYDYLGCQYRRTFAINEAQPWKEPLKRILCFLGFANIIRGMWRKPHGETITDEPLDMANIDSTP